MKCGDFLGDSVFFCVCVCVCGRIQLNKWCNTRDFCIFSMCNEFSQIFQLCQFVMVRKASIISTDVWRPALILFFIFACVGKLPECPTGSRHAGDPPPLPELDSVRLYFWDQADQHSGVQGKTAAFEISDATASETQLNLHVIGDILFVIAHSVQWNSVPPHSFYGTKFNTKIKDR